MPTNPNTPNQAAARIRLANFSQDYKAMDDGEKAAWRELGDQMQRSDSLGQSYSLSGLQAFTSINVNLTKLGLAAVTIAPAMPESVGLVTLGAISATEGGAFTVAFTPTPVPADSKLVIEASGPVSAGKNFVPRSAYKFIQAVNAAGTSPATITTNWEAIYGPLTTAVINPKVFVRACFVDSLGFQGPYNYGFVFIQ